MTHLLSRRHPAHSHPLPAHVENVIRKGLYDWFEQRSYRNPDDSIVTLADTLGVSTAEIAEYLRFHLDVKYCTLRRILRIQDAALMLLLLPDKSLTCIGNLVGISNPSNFRKQFSGYTHHSPYGWRKRLAVRRRSRERKKGGRRVALLIEYLHFIIPMSKSRSSSRGRRGRP